jgi:hypothetical protein
LAHIDAWKEKQGTMHVQSAWFIEWFYHQLSKDERHSLKEWPESDVAKALMYDFLH